MKAVCGWLKPVALILVFNLCFNASYQLAELQVCRMCPGTVLNGTAVGQFCSESDFNVAFRTVGNIEITFKAKSNTEYILPNKCFCCRDLSLNPIVNMTDTAFEGFSKLNYMILPQDTSCPGGNTSWEKVEVREGNRFCQGQKNMCNQTEHMSVDCPENSLCAPYGPGFFECSCADQHHGYKCLREGEFPALQVFGPLAASTVVISFLLWVTQRRKAKSL
uniref:All-trans retinoic acid induced differentiation factor n=1 Tax=Stegastes partitus TaxID=144197 RepID=A0A3B5AHG0_9TELE